MVVVTKSVTVAVAIVSVCELDSPASTVELVERADPLVRALYLGHQDYLVTPMSAPRFQDACRDAITTATP